MRSDPRDVLAAIRLAKATVRKLKQNLFWAAIYDVVAIPIAAGVLYPAFGILLRPEFGALAMSASSIPAVTNALLLPRAQPRLRALATARPGLRSRAPKMPLLRGHSASPKPRPSPRRESELMHRRGREW